MLIEGVDVGAVVKEQRQDFLIVRTLCRQVKRSHATVASGADIGPSVDQNRHTPRIPGCGMQSGSAVFVAGASTYSGPDFLSTSEAGPFTTWSRA